MSYSNGIGRVAKYRFDGPEPLAVDVEAPRAVNLALHPFDEAGFLFQCDIDLPWCPLGRVPEAAFSQTPACAVFFMGLELHE